MTEPLGRFETVPVTMFSRTVEAAKKLINSGRNLRYDWTDPEGFLDSHRETLGCSMLSKNPEELIELAKVDWSDFRALQLGLAMDLQMGREIADCAKVWLADFLRGKIKEPRKKSGRKQSEGLTVLIYFAVQNGVGLGLTATRNDETSTGVSACDAVAEALRQLRLPYASFDAVKDIWEQGKRHFAKPENQGIPCT